MLQRKFKKFPGLGSSVAFSADEDSKEIEILHEIYDDLKATRQDFKDLVRMSQKCSKALATSELKPLAQALASYQDRLADGDDKEAIEGSAKRLSELMQFIHMQRQSLVHSIQENFEHPTSNYVQVDILEAVNAMAAFNKINESYRQINKKVKSMNSKKYSNMAKFQEVQLEQTQLKKRWENQKEETMHCVSKTIAKHEFFAVERMNMLVDSYKDYFLVMAEHMDSLKEGLQASNDRIAEKQEEFMVTFPEAYTEARSPLSPVSPRFNLSKVLSRDNVRPGSFSSHASGGKPDVLTEVAMLREQAGLSQNSSDSALKRNKKRVRSISVDKRYALIAQTLANEKSYVEDLQKIATIRQLIMLDEKAVSKISEVTLDIIFSNVEDITFIHMELLANLQKMAANWSPRQCIGGFFLTQADRMQIYAEYIREFPTSSYCLQKCRKSKHFDSTLKAAEATVGAPLQSLLSAPLPRIAQFCVFLEKLTNDTPRQHKDYDQLTNALIHFTELNSFVSQSNFSSEHMDKLNELQARIQGIDAEGITLADAQRRLVKEGALGLVRSGADVPEKAGKREECYAFLFNDIMVFTKKPNYIIKNKNKQLAFLSHVRLAEATMEVDFVQGGFRLATDSTVYAILCDKQEERDAWRDTVSSIVKELQKPKVFGVPFEELMQSDTEKTRVTPSLLEACSKFLEDSKFTAAQFTRNFAPFDAVEELKESIDRGGPALFNAGERKEGEKAGEKKEKRKKVRKGEGEKKGENKDERKEERKKEKEEEKKEEKKEGEGDDPLRVSADTVADDPAVVAGLFFKWLKELPEPLSTFALFNDFLNASSSIVQLKEVVQKLPVFDKFSLEMVVGLLHTLAFQGPSGGGGEEGEKREEGECVEDMAVMVGPFLFRSGPLAFDMHELPRIYALTRRLIVSHREIFSEVKEEREKVERDSKALSHLRRQYVSLQSTKHGSGTNVATVAPISLSDTAMPSVNLSGMSKGAQAMISPRNSLADSGGASGGRRNPLKDSKRKKKRSSTHLGTSEQVQQWQQVSKADAVTKRQSQRSASVATIGSPRADAAGAPSSSPSHSASTPNVSGASGGHARGPHLHSSAAFGSISRSIASTPNVSSGRSPSPLVAGGGGRQSPAPGALPAYVQGSGPGTGGPRRTSSPVRASPPAQSPLTPLQSSRSTGSVLSTAAMKRQSTPSSPLAAGAYTAPVAVQPQQSLVEQRPTSPAPPPPTTTGKRRSQSHSASSLPAVQQQQGRTRTSTTVSTPPKVTVTPAAAAASPAAPMASAPARSAADEARQRASRNGSLPAVSAHASAAPPRYPYPPQRGSSSGQFPVAAMPAARTSTAPAGGQQQTQTQQQIQQQMQQQIQQLLLQQQQQQHLLQPQTTAPPPAASSACGACGKATGEGRLALLGKYWHRDCFVCTTCRQPFKDGKFFEHGGLPYCEREYRSLQTICAGCKQPIAGAYLQAMGTNWHPEHFVCANCSGSLSSGFFELQGKPFCNTCKRSSSYASRP